MELFLLIGFTLWFSCFCVVVMTVFSAARSATAYVRDTIYKAATILKVNSTRHLLACRHCCWLELQLRELWKIRINAWECCKDEANLGCKNKWHRCWMKYLRNTFKHTCWLNTRLCWMTTEVGCWIAGTCSTVYFIILFLET